MISNCLKCNQKYKIDLKASPEEYPYCDSCNHKEFMKLSALWRTFNTAYPVYRKENKNNKKLVNSEKVQINKMRIPKFTIKKNKIGFYENFQGSLNGIEII